jgi:hypothetical protein
MLDLVTTRTRLRDQNVVTAEMRFDRDSLTRTDEREATVLRSAMCLMHV